ncbi:MAG: hypothetical protein LBI70_00690 [Rickettsiales bacterium]|jgi:tetratricopeptide (TPR) repeat protein|nr:hypothetical protein [Rickettsiales bacterium]
MATDSDNFINELKFDEFKENTKKFLLKYFHYIVIVTIILVGFFAVRLSLKIIEKNKTEKYSEKIFLSLSSEKPAIELEKIHRDGSAPSTTKTFSGLALAEEYLKNSQQNEAANIYEDILRREKDVYLKYYAGLNLLILRLGEKNVDPDRINSLFLKLENDSNPLLDLVSEQKALFLIGQKKYDQAIEITENLLRRNDLNDDFKDRLGKYLDFLRKKL